MIRVIQRRLMIPRGDTGTFTIPLLPGTEQGDTAVFSIYDPLKQEVLLQLEKEITEEELEFEFKREDTINIEPSDRYVWDVKVYHIPERDANGTIINGATINSYYAAFKLPQCEICVAP